MSRAETIRDFLVQAGWPDGKGIAMTGDASTRRYERLADGGRQAILMDDQEGGVRPFLNIARYLTTHGFSAPEIFAANESAGLVLMEDLGESLVARIASEAPAQEKVLYLAATELLIALHRAPLPSGLKPYGPAEMVKMTAPAVEFYAPAVGEPVTQEGWLQLSTALEGCLCATDMTPPVMIHRDFHAENLLWLPCRSGAARIGVLDFQDALLGHPAYDLASLLQDVRRAVPAPLVEAAIRLYVTETGCDEALFRAGFAAQSAQRNLRILGMFARLCTNYGKPGYLAFMPRVWSLLQADLAHPELSTLRTAVTDTVPEPTPERIARIRAQSA